MNLFNLDTSTVVALVVAVVLPALSSLLAKTHWPAAAIGALTLLLSTADGFFSEWARDGAGFAWKAAIGTALLSYLVALGVRYGVLKDTALDAKLLAAGSGTPAVDTGPGQIAA